MIQKGELIAWNRFLKDGRIVVRTWGRWLRGLRLLSLRLGRLRVWGVR